MAVRMRKLLARPWVGVRVCHLLYLITICIVGMGHLAKNKLAQEGAILDPKAAPWSVDCVCC